MKKEEAGEKASKTKLVLAAAVLYIILGGALLLVPEIKVLYICYAVSVLLVVVGIILIVKYFMMEAYKNINEYGFSTGALLVALGMCSLVRENQVADAFLLCTGICILLTAIIKLQNAIDLKSLRAKSWPAILGASIVLIFCAVIIIINPFSSMENLGTFTYLILIADGIISIVSTIFVTMEIKRYKKLDIQQPEEDTFSQEPKPEEDTGESEEDKEAE